MVKLNFGCGTNRMPGWQNYDMDVDIRLPIPFPDNHADFIFAEHVVEHVTPHEAYNFFKECRRVLKPGGTVRIATPSVVQVAAANNARYLEFLRSHGWGDGTTESAVRAIVFEHGHQSIWSAETLIALFHSLGFAVKQVPVSRSEIPELHDIEGHARVIGYEFNSLETVCVEARKS